MVGIAVLDDATLIHDGRRSLLYVANLPAYGGKVILKLPKEQLDRETLLQLEHEYNMLRQFASPRIRAILGRTALNHQVALVMKYVEGLNLKAYLDQHRPSFSEKLIIAAGLCRLLEEVHGQGLLHGNFCSENIIIHPTSLSATLIDFKLASPVPFAVQETDVSRGPDLPYLAPELSGKASGLADERADLYSLGIVLYELFAEKLPFTAVDSQTLIHAHLAVDPPQLQQLAPEIPDTLAAMVHKLLVKLPENRYQTAAGIQADVEQCIALYQQNGKISPFTIACFDSVARLKLPTTLFGRDKEISQVREAWQRVSQGAAEGLWIAGQAGIGKTALASQLQFWVRKTRGLLARGKFDPLSASRPYDGLVQALNGLTELWLTKDEEEVAHWRSRIQQAVEREGRLLTDLVPRLKLLLGNQPPLAPLDGPEAQHRFHYVFRNFLKALAAADHPLVLQLDDLQWADPATLSLLQELLADQEFSHFLFVGLYREEEGGENPQLQALLQQPYTAFSQQAISLSNLQLAEVHDFLAETFHQNSPAVHQLAEVLYAKTKGNPLFLTQFLRTAFRQGLLWLEADKLAAKGHWAWELEKISQLPQTENVLSLIISRFNQLDQEVQGLLQVAACMGNQFERNLLLVLTATITKHPLSVLSQALQEGYVTKSGYEEEAGRVSVYRFLHDRLRQAVLSTIAEGDYKRLHLQIGKLLQQRLAQQEGQELIFDVVTHQTLAQELLTEDEHLTLAELSQQAAEKAMAAAGYSVALSYLERAISLLPAYSWQVHYPLSLALYSGAARAAYLQGAFPKMEAYLAEVLQHAQQEVDKARVLETKIQSLIASNQSAAAVNTALKAIGALGIKMPAHPSKAQILASLLQTEIMLRKKGLDRLSRLPLMTDPHTLAVMEIMGSVGSAVSRSAPTLFPLFICKLVQLSLKKGNALASIPAYSGWGVLQVAIFKNVQQGNAYGNVALQLLEKLPADAVVAKTHLVNAAFLDFWLHPVQNSIDIARHVYETGLKTGDFEFAASGLLVQCTHSYFAGVPLPLLAETMEESCQKMLQLKQELLYQQTRLFQQAVLNLMQDDTLSPVLQGQAFDEAAVFTEEFTATNKAADFYRYLNKMILAYMAGAYNQALVWCNLLARKEEHVMATIVVPVYVFYDGLLQARLYPSLSLKEQKQAKQRLTKAYNRMKSWARHAPANFLHKQLLLQAELLRIKGKAQKAKLSYELAAENAHQQGFLQGKALANELAGLHMLEMGKQEQAGIHLRLAHTDYLQWGARAKARQLIKTYPRLIQPQTTAAGANGAVFSHTKALPIEGLLKAAIALSSQMKLDKVLENLLATVLQQACAQEAYVILIKDDVLEVAAKGAADPPAIDMLSGIPVEEYQELPSSIINFSYRTGEELVLADAQVDNRFAHDPTVVMCHIRSVLCFPVVRQQRVLGLIYLHNTLSTGAFTDTQLQVLRLLSGQIAVALENAMLYTQMEQRIEERTREMMVQQQILKYKNEELQQLNNEKDELVNIVAHDLRSPLNQIRGMLNLIKLSPDNLTPDQQQFVDLCLKSSERLSSMIGRILDTNALDAQDIALNLEMVDLDILLEEVVTNFRIQAADKNITLHLVLPEEPIEIELDRNYTIQVLENLLSNALKFSPRETQVQVLLYTDVDVARIEVVDEGPGISPKDQKRLFSKFQTLSAKPTAGEASTGLGLSIAKRYVEAMGGNIGCTSEMGEGSTFYVEFVLV